MHASKKVQRLRRGSLKDPAHVPREVAVFEPDRFRPSSVDERAACFERAARVAVAVDADLVRRSESLVFDISHSSFPSFVPAFLSTRPETALRARAQVTCPGSTRRPVPAPRDWRS